MPAARERFEQWLPTLPEDVREQVERQVVDEQHVLARLLLRKATRVLRRVQRKAWSLRLDAATGRRQEAAGGVDVALSLRMGLGQCARIWRPSANSASLTMPFSMAGSGIVWAGGSCATKGPVPSWPRCATR